MRLIARNGSDIRSISCNLDRLKTGGAARARQGIGSTLRELIEAGESAFDAYLNLVVWNKTNAGQGDL